MASAIGLVKKQRHEQQFASQRQLEKNRKDAAAIHSIFLGLDNADIALKIISAPNNLRGLLSNHNGHNASCFYAVHALLIPLFLENIDYTHVLNQMSDANIKNLKEIITTAKKHSRPQTQIIEKVLQQHRKNGISEDNVMIQSLKISREVSDNWNVLVTELEKLTVAIDTFERDFALSKPTAATEPESEVFWTLEDLAEKMGLKNKNTLYKQKNLIISRNPELAEAVNSWFIPLTNGFSPNKVFRAKHFDKYKALYEKTKTQKTRSTKKAEPQAEKPVVAKKEPKKKVLGLADVKGMEALLQGLQELCDAAQKDCKAKEEAYNKAADAALTEQDANKRVNLLDRMTKANNELVAAKKVAKKLKTEIERGTNLTAEQTAAIEAMNSVNQRIKKFMSNCRSLCKK
ncbi:MAG: hypothetical protein MJ165_03755 [Alphaproteobacteria bacterium]|nr:hypothetical protein [Alphaproteobacteria bacterium]